MGFCFYLPVYIYYIHINAYVYMLYILLCDPQFLDNELEKIYINFSRLGYNRRFIVKANISTKKC